jgi:chromosome segregation ATPase
MNSPVYQERRRKEVRKEITDINALLVYYEKRLKEITEAIEKKERKEKGINTSSDKFTMDMHTPIDTLKELVRKFTRDIERKEAMRDNLIEWEESMDAPLPPPISYVQESNAESNAERNAESNALEHLNDVRGSANDREQLQRMREAHARFKKGRNEYMEEA